MRTGVANLPLHSGKAPAWLFQRMVKLSREIITLMVYEFGTRETLKKFSDPYWFQALGCVLGFDWHSSGVTTTVCGAVKEGLRGLQSELKLVVAGGNGLPHAAFCANHRGNILLNMVAGDAESNRHAVAHLAKEKPEKIEAEAKNIIECNLSSRHPVSLGDLNPRYFHKILLKTYERQPKNFQSLLEIEGVGPKTIRALAYRRTPLWSSY